MADSSKSNWSGVAPMRPTVSRVTVIHGLFNISLVAYFEQLELHVEVGSEDGILQLGSRLSLTSC